MKHDHYMRHLDLQLTGGSGPERIGMQTQVARGAPSAPELRGRGVPRRLLAGAAPLAALGQRLASQQVTRRLGLGREFTDLNRTLRLADPAERAYREWTA